MRSTWLFFGAGLLLAGSTATGPAFAGPVIVGGSLEVGVDSFAQKFRITELATLTSDQALTTLRDTTDTFQEMRTVLELRIQDDDGPLHWKLRPQASVGSELVRGGVAFDARVRPEDRSYRLDLDLDFDGRSFQEGSDFSLSSDFFRGNGRLRYLRKLSNTTELGFKLAAEGIDYEKRSSFEYDHRRGDASLVASFSKGFTFRVDLEAGGGGRVVPDSSAIDYGRGFGSFDLGVSPTDRLRLGMYGRTERRSYGDAGIRSAFWNMIAEPEVGLRLQGDWGLRLRAPQEWVVYDTASSIYYDLWLGHLGLEASRSLGDVQLSAEPRWSWLSSPQSVGEEYGQPSVVLRLEWFRLGRFWLSVSEEIGRRLYDGSGDDLDLYSDYTFFRTVVTASVTIVPDRLGLDLFLSDEPENHLRAEDDSRLSLLTMSLRASI